MMNWTRTLVGKTVLFLVCFLFTCSLFLSLFMTLGLFEMNLFTRTEQEAVESTITDEIDRYCNIILGNTVYPDSYDYIAHRVVSRNISMQIFDSHEKLIYSQGELDLDHKENVFYQANFGINTKYHRIVKNYSVTTERDADTSSYTVYADYDHSFPYTDYLQNEVRFLHLLSVVKEWVFLVIAVSLLPALISLICLLRSAGRRPGSQELYPGFLTRVPFDFLLMLFLCYIFIMIGIASEFSTWDTLLLIIFTIISGTALAIGLTVSAAVRIKMGTFFTNNLYYRAWNLLKRILKWVLSAGKKCWNLFRVFLLNLPLLKRTTAICAAVIILDFLLIDNLHPMSHYIRISFLSKFIISALVIYYVYELRKLQEAGRQLSKGNLEFRANTDIRFFPALREHAENLNLISEGMSLAVQEGVKSERMKTELITNVSHDLKTPLTSIINYAGLIAAEPAGSAKIPEYSDVLIRQSERLKRLLEDLVEASKASTGNLDVSLSPCDPSIFLAQISGEYEEKLQKADLTLICRYSEGTMKILADGRRMWRIFDNLMNNICKYSLPGTRVYLTLEHNRSEAVITFRNTSREELNLDPDELRERFVRGDSSRSTEGTGLGLSIADSLTNLQGGKMSIACDGDLFKVTLSFPLI